MALVPYPLNYQLCELPQNPIVDLMIPIVSHGVPHCRSLSPKANQSTYILGWAGGSMLAIPFDWGLGMHEWVH